VQKLERSYGLKINNKDEDYHYSVI